MIDRIPKNEVVSIERFESRRLRQRRVDLDTARKVIVNGMLADQPLPLRGVKNAVSARQ